MQAVAGRVGRDLTAAGVEAPVGDECGLAPHSLGDVRSAQRLVVDTDAVDHAVVSQRARRPLVAANPQLIVGRKTVLDRRRRRGRPEQDTVDVQLDVRTVVRADDMVPVVVVERRDGLGRRFAPCANRIDEAEPQAAGIRVDTVRRGRAPIGTLRE
jgi:hypothetical protein